MKEIVKGLWVGNDADYEKVKDKPEWFVVRAAKEGPGGHRDQLGYTTLPAPKGPNYLFVKKPHLLALNIVDHDSPDYFPDKMIDEALHQISNALGRGDKVLVCCNHGHSRGPSISLLWLALNGKLPFEGTFRKFKQLYPDYEPNSGIKQYLKRRLAARR